MTKKGDRMYRGIVIGLIFGFLMTGIMSFTVFAEEAESPPNTALTGESASKDEEAIAGPDALAESLSEAVHAGTDDGKAEEAQIADSGSASEASDTQKAADAMNEAGASKSEADAAQSGAETAKTEADTVQSGADTAKSEADAAQSGAETAKSEADTAKSGTAVAAEKASEGANAEGEEPGQSRALLAGASGEQTVPADPTQNGQNAGETGEPKEPTVPTSPTQTGEMAGLTDNSTSLTGDESLKGTSTANQADMENAIQKAVDAALASATSTTTTLRVDVESGDYTGGLKIAKPDGSSLNSKLILYVFAPGSYSGAATGAITTGKISAAADGSTKLSGDVLIDGINVVLAGIYYSLDTKITVRDAKADIYGTTGSDTINTVLDGSGTLVVHSGAGADDITVSGSTTTGGVVATVYGEAGDDTFNVDLLTGTKNASGTAPKQAEIRISDTDTGTLNLTGTLQEGNSSALSGTITMTSSSKRARVTAVNSEGYKTYINANGTTNYMDSLLNKKEVVLNAGDSVKAESFTDYVLSGTNADGITVDGTNAYFSNIKAVSDGTLTVGSIDAPLVNVVLQGTDIILNGTINAKNLTVQAAGKAEQSQEDLTIELAGVDTITVKGIADTQTAKIQVLKDAEIKANNISLTADTAAKIDRDALIASYGEKILSFESLASSILINGKIEAAAGSIKALANAVITMLTAGNAKASFDSLIALPEAVITIGENANLIATGDVLTKAVSRVIGAAKASFAETPYASDAVIAIGGKAGTTVAGRILAGGNVTVRADGSAQAETIVSGADTGLAVTAENEDVRAEVTGSGKIEALGKVDIISTLAGDFHTTASAGGQDQGYETTLTNTQATLKNILKAVSGFADADKQVLLEKLFAAMTEAQSGQFAGIDKMYEQAAASMADADVSASSAKNAFGATAVAYTGGTNFAGIDTDSYIYAGNGLSVKADADFASVVRADSFETAADEANPSAAAIANTIFENTAEIRSGAVYAKDLTVSAVSGKEKRPVTSVVKAYAGDGVYDGIAGAAALQKALASTKALIDAKAAINLLNRTSLAVNAVQYDRFVTVADAAAAGNGTTDGTGAGLAFAVTGADVRSAVEDGVIIKTFSPKMGAAALKRDEISEYIAGLTLLAPMVDKVAVTADRQGDEVIYASAGTAGGDENAIRAEAAIFSGSSVQAYLGNPGTDEVLDAAGNVDVTANNSGARQAAADADAVPLTGSGMVLTMTYTNDKSGADLQRALKSNNLTVRAVSNVKTRSRAKAGAQGTKKVKEPGSDGDDGEADQRASKILDGAASVASSGSSAISGTILRELGEKSAKAKSAEGSMGAAAAYAQNVEKNSAKANVSGKYDIVASGDLILEAIGENGADILADASSVKKSSDGTTADGTTAGGETGIGTAAAVSVVDYDFTAVLDSGKVTATSVTIHAGIQDAEAASYKVAAVSGEGNGQPGLVGSIAINEVYGTSVASIAAGTAQISAAEDMVIKAEDRHSEETIATAGISEDGKPVRTAEDKSVAAVGVGAAFALSDIRTETKAAVGEGRVVEGLRVYLLADNKDVRGTYSLAGKDPSAYGQDLTAAAADASAAVSIGESRSIALADEGSHIIADGTPDGSEIERTGNPKAGDIYMKGLFTSDVRTTAGIFESSSQSYYGGAVAVNLAGSDANAEMLGFATANGNVLILADSDDTDRTKAASAAMPVDLRRYLVRMGLAGTLQEVLDLVKGEISGSGTNTKNEIATRINEALNGYKDEEGADAVNSNPLTYNVLASQNAKSEGTEEAHIVNAQEESNKLAASGTNVSVGEGIIRNDLPGTVVRAAAALGLNVTEHNAYALVRGTIDKTNRNVDIRAEVTGSAEVKGSAANVHADGDSRQNAFGAALSINRNTAAAEIAKGTAPARVESKGGVSLTAEQKRNLSDTDRSRFEADAASGFYGNDRGQIFGTLVIVRSESQTEALVADETTINANLDKKGGDVTVTAVEKGRIAATALGTTFGPASVIVDAEDIIRAEIGRKAQVAGNYIIVQAMKEAAGNIPELDTFSGGQEYVSVTARGTDEDTVYQVAADTSEFSGYLRKHSVPEYLRGADYLLTTSSNEIVASTFRGIKAQGASTILREALRVSVSIGKEAVLTAEGNINLMADTSSKAAVLLGANAFEDGSAHAEIGTSVVLMTSQNVTETVIGDDARITADGYYVQNAMEDAVKTAAVLPGNTDSFDAISPGGGSIVVLRDADEVLSDVGTGAVIEGGLGVTIGAALYNDKDSLVSYDNRKAGKRAKGGNNSYILSKSTVLTRAGINAKIRSSKGDVFLTADTKEQMISIPGSNADALPGAIAAVMNIMRSESSTIVETGKVEITAKGDVHLEAKAASYLVAVDPASDKAYLFSPSGVAIFFDAARLVETLLGEGSTVTAGGNVWLISELDEKMLIAPASIHGDYREGLTGLAAGAKSRNIVRTVAGAKSGQDWNAKEISDAAAVTSVTAEGSIAVTAVLDSLNEIVTAGVDDNPSASNGGAAAAIIEKNIVDAVVNTMAYLKAMASLPAITVEKAGTDSSGKKKTDSRTGITIYAGAKEDILMTVEGAAASGGVSVNGTIADVNVANTVRARVGKEAQLFAGTEITDEFTGEVGDTGTAGDVHIEAEDLTDAVILAGGLSRAEAKTESPTVLYGYFGKTVTAKNEGLVTAAKNTAQVYAYEKTKVDSFVTASGPAGQESGVSGALYFKNRADAFASGFLRGGRQVAVNSRSEETLNTVETVRDAEEASGNTGSAILVYLYNGALAGIGDGSTVLGGNVFVTAAAYETVNAYVQGTTGRDDQETAGGSLMVVLTGSEIAARIGADAYVGGAYSEKARDVRVTANNTYDLRGVVGTDINTDSTKGGISAAASVSYNKVEASVGRNTQMKVKNLLVTGDSLRRVNLLTAMLGKEGGTVETAGTAAVVAIGSLLNKDAHDAIFAGGQSILPAAAIRHILTRGGTAVGFNDFTEGSLPTIDLNAILETGMAGVGETIAMANGTETYVSLFQPTGDAASEPDSAVYRTLDGKITRKVTRYNGWEDYVSAWIEPDAVVEAESEIMVSATDTVNLYVLSGAVGSDTEESVGSGTAAVFMNANVYADVYGKLKSGSSINIFARAQSGIEARKELSFRGTSVFESLGHAAAQKGLSPEKETNRTGIYALAIAGAQGAPGGRDSVAYTSASSMVAARLHGTVEDAKMLNILATFDFASVHAASIAAAKGNRDLTRILALEYYDGFAEAGITNTAAVNISGNSLNVITTSKAGMAPRAGIPGSGTEGGSVVTAAAAVNRTEAHAYIAGGVRVNAEAADIVVNSITTSKADVEILAETADDATLDMGLVIAVNDPKNVAYIGSNSVRELAHTGSRTGIGSINAKNVHVNAVMDVTSDIRGHLFSNGQSGHLNGLVVLGITDAQNNACVAGTGITADSLTIRALSHYDMNVTGEAGEYDVYGIGGTAAAGFIGAANMAELYAADAVIKVTDLTVSAGTDEERSTADVIVTVTPGGLTENLSKAMNIAAARSELFNLARVNGGENSGKMGEITAANDVKIYSALDSLAKAEVATPQSKVAADAIGAGAAFAYQGGDSASNISYTRLTAMNIYMQSRYNSAVGIDDAGTLREDKGAIAIVTPARDPENILAKHLTYAGAVFRGVSVSELYGCDVNATLRTEVNAFGQSYAKALMDAPKVNYNYGRIGVNLIHADAAGVFKAEVVEPLENGTLSARNLEIIVSYIAISDAMTSMIGGQKVSGEGKRIEYNTAEAFTGTFAEASLKRLVTGPNVLILVNGEVAAHAYAAETVFAYSEEDNSFDVMAAVTTAKITVEQRAHMDPETLTSATRVSGLYIRSSLKGYPYFRESEDTKTISGACAETGYPVFEEDSMKACLLPLVMNRAESVVEAVNLAYIYGPGEIYSSGGVVLVAETNLNSLGGVRLSPQGVETAVKLGTAVSALTRNRTEASIGSYILLALERGDITVASTDSSRAEAESLYASGIPSEEEMRELVQAGIGTLDREKASTSPSGDTSTMSVTRSRVGKHTYLQGQRVSFVTVNNNWAEAGMKDVEGYTARGDYVNIVPTVIAAYCDVEIGDETTILARFGDVSLHTHSYLDSTAKASSAGTNFEKEEKLAAENVTRQDERILIGQRAYIEARSDISIVIRGTVKMEAAVNNMNNRSGNTVARATNILERRAQIDLSKQARLRTYYGDITLHIIASGDEVSGADTSDHLTADADLRKAPAKLSAAVVAKNDVTVTAIISTWENSEIYAPFGTVNLKVQDGYGENTSSNGKRETFIAATASGVSSGSSNGKGVGTNNTYTENLQVAVIHSTIIGNNVNLTASRESMKIIAESIAKMTNFMNSGQTADAVNVLTFNTDVFITNGSYVRGYSNVSITSKTESADLTDNTRGRSTVRATSEIQNSLSVKRNSAVNTGSMREKISISDASYIYGRAISMNVIGWTEGDVVSSSGASRSLRSDFYADSGTEMNSIEIDDGSILFVGSMAGALVDIGRNYWDNTPELRQIGLESTPEMEVGEDCINRISRMIPDQTPGMLIVNRVRRIYERSAHYQQVVNDQRDLNRRAVSGGALTDTTILNRTGLPIASWSGIALDVRAPRGTFKYDVSDQTKNSRYSYIGPINQAADSYPAGGLISEVYYEQPIMGPTVTNVGAERSGTGGYTPGIGSSVEVYRDMNGRLKTEVRTYDQFGINHYSNSESGLSDAGSYYSFTGTRPDWIIDRIIAAYAEQDSSEGSRYNFTSGSQNAASAAGSRNTAGATNGSQNAGNAAGNRDAVSGSNTQNTADGSTKPAAGSNTQNGTDGSQAAGNASSGTPGSPDDDIKGSGSGSDVDPDDASDGSDGTSALAMGGKMIPVAGVAAVGALFVIFLLLKRRKEEEEQ